MTLSRATRSFALAAATVLLGACYDSSEPIGKPGKTALDLRLSGRWVCRSPPREGQSEKEAFLWVIPFDRQQFFAEWKDGDDVSRYRAYPTQLGHGQLLNIEELTFRISGFHWIFMRYTFGNDGTLRLSVVSEGALGDLKGKAAVAAIERRIEDDSLYEPFAVCGES